MKNNDHTSRRGGLLLGLAVLMFVPACVQHKTKPAVPSPTPLVGAILRHDTARVRELLDSGADPNGVSAGGGNVLSTNIGRPLTWALWPEAYHDTDVLSLLMKHGANPNLPVHWAWFMANPLHEAISLGSIPAILFLLRHGADPNGRCPVDGAGYSTPLKSAIISHMGTLAHWHSLEHIDSLTYLARYDSIVTILLNHGASPTLVDQDGETPLHVAARCCDSAAAAELLARGVSPTAKDSEGYTPLDRARKSGCTAIIRMLEAARR